jgi:hypothetical protein
MPQNTFQYYAKRNKFTSFYRKMHLFGKKTPNNTKNGEKRVFFAQEGEALKRIND